MGYLFGRLTRTVYRVLFPQEYKRRLAGGDPTWRSYVAATVSVLMLFAAFVAVLYPFSR